MPWPVLKAKVMQSTTGLHDAVTNAVLQEAYLVFHNPGAFHPTNGLFNPHADRGDPTIGRLCRRCQFPSRRFFLGLPHCNPWEAEALEPLILIEVAPRWEGITGQLCHAFIRCFAFTGRAQTAHVTGLVDHEEGFKRVTRLLAAVICLLLFEIGRAVDRPCSTIMPKRGDAELPSVMCVLNIAANSAAVRAGSSSWSAKACFNTGCRR